jgi:hypothetical protein
MAERESICLAIDVEAPQTEAVKVDFTDLVDFIVTRGVNFQLALSALARIVSIGCDALNIFVLLLPSETRFGRTRLLPSCLLAANSTFPLVNVRTRPKEAPQERRSPVTY